MRGRTLVIAVVVAAAFVHCSSFGEGEGGEGTGTTGDAAAEDARTADSTSDDSASGRDAGPGEAGDAASCLGDGSVGCPTTPCCSSLSCTTADYCAPSCGSIGSGCGGSSACCFGLRCDPNNAYCCIQLGGACADAQAYCCQGTTCISGFCQ